MRQKQIAVKPIVDEEKQNGKMHKNMGQKW